MTESDPAGFAAIIAAMTVAVYVTRAGGYWLIGRLTIGPRLRRMLDALPGAIIAATITPVLAHGGVSAFAAVVAAAGVMIVVRKDFIAVAAAVLVTVAVRFAGF